MTYSLLAHLFPFIKGSQEDIATLSLQYLLSQSDNLNRAFTQRLSEVMKLKLENKLKYKCQVVGKNEEKERPDMVGIDKNGTETILFEMKFYATLTINQPLTYIKRLKENGGKGLMFVCPLSRRTSLWAKLLELCHNLNIEIISDYCVNVDGIRLSIMTWTDIIELFKQVSASTDISFTSDILQLEGYCSKIDSDSFTPYTAEHLSSENAKLEDRHYRIVDEVIDLICADKEWSTSKKSLKATAYRKGYTRSLRINNLTLTINYDRDMWKNPETIETPFWFAIKNGEWKQTAEICEVFNTIPENYKGTLWGMIYLAVEPMQNATFTEVCEDIKNKIIKQIREVELKTLK